MWRSRRREALRKKRDFYFLLRCRRSAYRATGAAPDANNTSVLASGTVGEPWLTTFPGWRLGVLSRLPSDCASAARHAISTPAAAASKSHFFIEPSLLSPYPFLLPSVILLRKFRAIQGVLHGFARKNISFFATFAVNATKRAYSPPSVVYHPFQQHHREQYACQPVPPLSPCQNLPHAGGCAG